MKITQNKKPFFESQKQTKLITREHALAASKISIRLNLFRKHSNVFCHFVCVKEMVFYQYDLAILYFVTFVCIVCIS